MPKNYKNVIVLFIQTDGGLFFFDDQFGMEVVAEVTLGTLDSSRQSRSDIRRHHIRRPIVRELA